MVYLSKRRGEGMIEIFDEPEDEICEGCWNVGGDNYDC